MLCDLKCSSIVTYFFVRWSPDYTWPRQSFCRQQRFKRPLPIASGKANRQRKMENLALYITTIGHNLCTFDAIFLHDKKDNFFKQCSFLKIHFYRLILTFNFMASNQKAKIELEILKKCLKQNAYIHVLPLPVLPICWRQRQANLPIAGGKGNYWQNAMYSCKMQQKH